jgi:hypothetical protein
MKQNEILLEKKFNIICNLKKKFFFLINRVTKLEELHHILKKNVVKLEKTVSQCKSIKISGND